MTKHGILALGVTALLLAGLFSPAEAKPDHKKHKKTTHAPKLVRVTYPVADLVVPVDMTGEGKQLAPELKEDHAPHAPGFPKSAKTLEDQLINLICNTVAPDSWSGVGGRGTLQYYPVGMALVVNQTPDVQEQIQDLLAALRRLQDLEVALEVRWVSLFPDALESLRADQIIDPETLIQQGKVVFLDESAVRRFVEKVQSNQRSSFMQLPKITVFNGQCGRINVGDHGEVITGLDVTQQSDRIVIRPKKETMFLGVQFRALPVIAADRRSVNLSMELKLTNLDSPEEIPITLAAKDQDGKEQEIVVQKIQRPKITSLAVEQSFRVAVGQSALFFMGKKEEEHRNEFGPPLLSKIPYLNRFFKTVGYGREIQHLFVLVTPRIIINEEEEQPLLPMDGKPSDRGD